MVYIRKKKLNLAEAEERELPTLLPIEDVKPVKPAEVPTNEWVLVIRPDFSPTLRAMMGEQFRNGEVKHDQFKLPDGTIMERDKAYPVRATPEIKQLLVKGVLKGGGTYRGKPPI